jgi:hypothetical protein
MAKKSRSHQNWPLSEPLASGYISGIIDGEGNVDSKKKRIRVSNTDYDIIEAYKECLEFFGIQYTEYANKKYDGLKQTWTVYVNRRTEIEKLAMHIYLRAPDKHQSLQDILNSYIDMPTMTYEEAYELYIIQGMSVAQVAKVKGCCSAYARKLMSELGIEIRPQGVKGYVKKKKLLPDGA